MRARSIPCSMLAALSMFWSGCQKHEPVGVPQGRPEAMVVEIVPKQSIGEIRLGAKRSELPAAVEIHDGVGNHRGTQFLLDGDTVDDVWIDDLRSFPHELRFRGQPVQKHASVEELKALFGPCTKVEGVLGGIYFNCDTGLTLGLDAQGQGQSVQIRLKPR
jgi:hypothetical protein